MFQKVGSLCQICPIHFNPLSSPHKKLAACYKMAQLAEYPVLVQNDASHL